MAQSSSITSQVLVVRGDLRSHTGYSRALRAHLDVLSLFFDKIIGVDIHYHKDLSILSFPYDILLSDLEIESLIKNNNVTILNYCIPELFIRHPQAVKNVGLFYWETDRFNSSRNWDSFIHLMDEIWVPSRYNLDLIHSLNFKGPVFYFPWPQQIASSRETLFVKEIKLRTSRWYKSHKILKNIPFFKVIYEPLFLKYIQKSLLKRKLPIETIRNKHDQIFLSIMQNMPRKGFYLTISEWMHFLKFNSKNFNACLILKISSLHHEQDPTDFFYDIEETINDLNHYYQMDQCCIYVVIEKISDAQLESLYAVADALISTTLGEGFGGPMVEAGMRGLPVIAPRHSALQDIIPTDWPLSLKFENTTLSLKHQLGYYALSSNWGLISARELSKMLNYFCNLSPQVRKKMSFNLQSHCIQEFSFKNIIQNVQDRRSNGEL